MTYNSIGRCPECGAPTVDGMRCWEQLGLLLAWEFDDPELQAEHFLTVASYNLQHPAQFTNDALAGLRTMLIAHVDDHLPVAAIRHHVGRIAAGNQPVLKRESERQLVLRAWRMTIADVYIPDKPQAAATRVRAWAASIRQELEQM